MIKVNDLAITKHARRRIGQRGITRSFLEDLLVHADRETDVGGDVVALSVTLDRANSLNISDRLHRFAVLVSGDGAVVSILPLHSGRRGSCYRRAS